MPGKSNSRSPIEDKWKDTLGKARSAEEGAPPSASGAHRDMAGSQGGAQEPLLPSTSAGGSSQLNHRQPAGAGGSPAGSTFNHQRSQSHPLAEEAVRRLQMSSHKGHGGDKSKLFAALRQRSVAGQVEETQVRKFIIRLATALHTYGSSAARTEYLIEKAAARLEVDVGVAVFPSLVLLSFGDGKEDSTRRETVLLTVSQDLDVDKLGRVDELARNIGQDKHQVLVAYWQLRAIASSPGTFGLAYRLAAYLMMAASAAPLFFGGSLSDAFVAGLLGLAGGLVELWANCMSPVAASVVEFLAAVLSAFAARALIAYAPHNALCFYPIVLASLVWFLPGLSLTLGVNELVAKTFVAGSSHVVASIFSAFQLGFGIAMGSALVFWEAAPLSTTCSDAVAPLALWAKGLWFGLYILASNVLLNARADQWPGMCIVSFVGYAVSEYTVALGSEASSILAACAISISGTLYSRATNQFPLAMKTAGILVLVPGGIGVSGVAALLQNNSAGTIFVFEMLMVALAITLGLLIGKIFFPEALFGYTGRTRVDKHRMAEELQRENFMEGLGPLEEEEDMAF